MKKTLIVLTSLILIGAGVKEDNYSLLMSLRESAMDVITKYQDFINRNKDGSYAKKKVTRQWIAKKTYNSFKEISKGKNWNIKALKGSHDRHQLAVALTVFLASARNVIATVQPIINTDADGTPNPKNFYPAVFGRYTAEEFEKKTGIIIKQTTTGKGMGPRNKHYNEPDGWEKRALQNLLKKQLTDEYGFGEEVTIDGKKVYRYIYPLDVKKSCLNCHGGPKGEKDIAGYVKEGYKLGELRGGISITIPW